MSQNEEELRGVDGNENAAVPASQSLSHLQKVKLIFIPHRPKPLTKLGELRSLLDKIPQLTGLLKSLDRAGLSLGLVAGVLGDTSSTLTSATQGFQLAQLGFVALDFFRILLIWIAAFIVNEKLPFTLSKTARFLYAAGLLALTILTIALPMVALPIGLAIAALVLADSLITLTRMAFKYFEAKRQLKIIQYLIDRETEPLQKLHRSTIDLEVLLSTAIKNKDTEAQRLLREQLRTVTAQFDALYANSRESLQALYDAQAKYQDKLKKINVGAVADKAVMIALATLGLCGTVISIFFPPIGLGLLVASAISASIYFISRITISLVNRRSAVKQTIGPKPMSIELSDMATTERDMSYKKEESYKNAKMPSRGPAKLTNPYKNSKLTMFSSKTAEDKGKTKDETPLPKPEKK